MSDQWQRKIRRALDRITRLAEAATGSDTGEDQLGLCTTSAEMLAENLGGATMGYFHEDNPTLLSEDAGGHDFALVGNGRYIADWWAKHVFGARFDLIDLHDPDMRQYVREHYGRRTAWRKQGSWR